MQGYYKEPEATAAVFDADGWLHTGDLAYRDSDGYFFVVGRSKELIIKGGVNIAPRQIDEVLESHPAVREAAVVGVPDLIWARIWSPSLCCGQALPLMKANYSLSVSVAWANLRRQRGSTLSKTCRKVLQAKCNGFGCSTRQHVAV